MASWRERRGGAWRGGGAEGFSPTRRTREVLHLVDRPTSAVCRRTGGRATRCHRCRRSTTPEKPRCRRRPTARPSASAWRCAPSARSRSEDFRELSRMEVRRRGARRRAAARRRGARGEAVPPAGGRRAAAAAVGAAAGVLQRLSEHLLGVWTENPDEAPLTRYLADRLRAVVRDLTVQRLHCDAIFERIALHAWAERLCRVPPSQASRRQNRDQLCNALISLLHAPRAAARREGRRGGRRRRARRVLGLPAAAPRRPAARVPGGAGARAARRARRPRVHRALRVAGAVGCAAAPRSRARCAPRRRSSSAARCGCCRARAATLEQHNAAYNNREAFPLADLARLLLPDAAAAARRRPRRRARARGRDARRRLRAAPFRARTDKGGLPTAALDPPLPPPVDLAEMNAEALLALWMRGAPE